MEKSWLADQSLPIALLAHAKPLPSAILEVIGRQFRNGLYQPCRNSDAHCAWSLFGCLLSHLRILGVAASIGADVFEVALSEAFPWQI